MHACLRDTTSKLHCPVVSGMSSSQHASSVFLYLVRLARVEKHALGTCGLSGINVGADTDVSVSVKRHDPLGCIAE